MYKILYIVSTLKRAGPTNQLYNLIKHLDRSQFEPYLITLSPETDVSRWDDFEALGVNLYTLGLSRIKGLFVAKHQLRNKIAQINPNIIHTHGIRADSLLASIKINNSWLLTTRNYPWHDYPMKFGNIKGFLMAYRHISIMHKCSYVVACSKSIAKLLDHHGVVAKSIQNGVELQKGSDKKVAHIADLPKPVFISVGHLIARKNMSFLIEAFNQYAKTCNGSLIILGNGEQMQELSALANERIHLVGAVPNVADYLAFSDYFISASLSEGLPNTVLEAMAAGLPVLLSDIPAHLEIAEECRSACAIFSLSEGPSALADKMVNIDSLFPVYAKEDALHVAREVFSAQIMSKKYQNLYSSLVSKRDVTNLIKNPDNGYNYTERLIAKTLSRFPIVKRLIKSTYVRIMYYKMRKNYKYKTIHKLKKYSIDKLESFFGYYDKSPISKDGYVLCYLAEKTYKLPSAKKGVTLSLFHQNGSEILLQLPVSTYNWQQGARAQWIDDDLFIFNDFDYVGKKYIARVFSSKKLKEVTRFPWPVQDCFGTKYFLSINYRRLAAMRPDYGYRNLRPLSKAELADIKNDGIWKVDYHTGQCLLLYTLAQICAVKYKEEFRNARHKVNHVMISPSGKQFIFLHRYLIGKRRKDRLILASASGGSLKLLSDSGMVSHCFWINDSQILGFLRGPRSKDGYYVIDIISGEFTPVANGALDAYGDGHPNVYGDWFVTDTYPNKAQIQHLLLCNWRTGELIKLGEFFHGFHYSGESRCDLHPRFSLDGKSIYFDSVFEGNRKLYRMDVEF